MRLKFLTSFALTGILASSVSCSSVKNTVAKIPNPVKSLAGYNKNDLRNFKISDLKRNAPPVVAVRTQDLKRMETAEEKIIAWNSLKRSQQLKYGQMSATGEIFMPLDFDPSDLPVDGQIPRLGVLPSITGSSASLVGREDQGDLLLNEALVFPPVPQLGEN